MNKITGNRESVLKIMKETIGNLSRDEETTKLIGKNKLGLKSVSQWPSKRDEIVDNLQRAYRRAADEPLVKNAKGFAPGLPQAGWYAPRDQTIALFQSAMDEYLNQREEKAVPSDKPATDSDAKEAIVGEQFDVLDPGWMEIMLETVKLKLKGKHKFITHKKVDDFRFALADKAKIAIVGDWGGGNEAAQLIAERIRSENPDHVIHLGDVYYAGTEKEVKERFLKYWNFWDTPAVPGRSLALNSNHEMYSGGYSYFDITLKAFLQPASYFSLSNDKWQFIGLDTGYVDHSLNKEQVDWLSAQLQDDSRKNILLSHHQLFSAYEDIDDALETWVKPFLDANKIYGWFWGHEHLEVIYGQYKNVKARCLGNGCFPYEVPGNVRHPEVPIEFLNNKQQEGHLSHGMHSFAVIEVDGSEMTIRYIDQDGVVAHEEVF